MAAIDDIIKWASGPGFPKWQADAVRRLLSCTDAELHETDYEEVFALAKSELGIDNSSTLLPVPPQPGDLSGAPSKASRVKLLALKNIRNVNLIRFDQEIEFDRDGVTVIYGGNGTGKSGYARILKLACQARDKDERVLPNVFAASAGKPSASILIEHDGVEQSIKWQSKEDTDRILTNITVFDGRCARVITDKENEIIYQPYGSEVFQKLANLVNKIKSDIQKEIKIVTPIQDSGILPGTAPWNFLDSLTSKSLVSDIDRATEWTDHDESTLAELTKLEQSTVGSSVDAEMERLRLMRGKIERAITIVQEAESQAKELGDFEVRSELKDYLLALDANQRFIDSTSFEGYLPGTGISNEWQILYEAAKKYSLAMAYPDMSFPNTGNGAQCVLCQQDLKESGVHHLNRFNRFMEDQTRTQLEKQILRLDQLRQRVQTFPQIQDERIEDLIPILRETDQSSVDTVSAYQMKVADRLRDLGKVVLKPALPFEMALWPDSILEPLTKIAKVLKEREDRTLELSRPEEQLALGIKLRDLRSRKALNARKVDIGMFVKALQRKQVLEAAVHSLKTGSITKQGTDIIKRHLTPSFIKLFTKELERLGVAHLSISVKQVGNTGETALKMEIAETPYSGNVALAEILSEGEARVVALAGFFAEIQLAPSQNSLVMDDPVSSLDHVYTRKIAERIIAEGVSRQIVLFTHNLSFLMELETAKDNSANRGTPVNLTVRAVRRIGKESGVTDNAPWLTLKSSQRAEFLRSEVKRIADLAVTDMHAYNIEASRIYGLLREAWEAFIEEDLLNQVVTRYRSSVGTMRLAEVSVEDSDVLAVELGMSNASRWLTGHESSKGLDVDRPNPTDILDDIKEFADLASDIHKRLKKTKARRKALLLPKPEIVASTDAPPRASIVA